MARNILNRKELRSEAEAAEQLDSAGKATAVKTKKSKSSRKSRSKGPGDVRMKLFWGVFNQSLKRVAVFEYADKKSADEKAAELSKAGKSPHFVQKIKEVISE